MACLPKKITLTDAFGEDHAYMFLHLPGRKGLRLQNKLLRILTGSASLAGLASEADGDGMLQAGQAVGGALGGVLDRLMDYEGEDGGALFIELLEGSTRDGAKFNGTTFDVAFAGNYAEMYEALGHAIKHNFASVLGLGNVLTKLLGPEAAGLFGQFKAQLMQIASEGLSSFSETLSPEASTGSSGSAPAATTPAA